jgi:hypothetical protein
MMDSRRAYAMYRVSLILDNCVQMRVLCSFLVALLNAEDENHRDHIQERGKDWTRETPLARFKIRCRKGDTAMPPTQG